MTALARARAAQLASQAATSTFLLTYYEARWSSTSVAKMEAMASVALPGRLGRVAHRVRQVYQVFLVASLEVVAVRQAVMVGVAVAEAMGERAGMEGTF